MSWNFSDDWSSAGEDEESEVEEKEYDYSATSHSKFMMQSGRASVGGFHTDEPVESKRVEVAFDTAFSEEGDVPMVFIQAEGENGQTYGDVFGVTLIEATHAGFTCNIGRAGECKGWGQNVGLNWVAIISTGNPMVTTTQIEVGDHDRQGDDGKPGSKNCEMKFAMPLPKGSRPFMMATCVGGDHTDTFSVTLKSLNRKNASFNVSRLWTHGGGWGQNLRLNVCYFNQGLFPCLRVNIGNSEEDNLKIIKDVAYPIRFRRRPLPFTMAMHPHGGDPGWADSMIVTAANVENDKMQLNVLRADANAGWGMQARCVICFLP